MRKCVGKLYDFRYFLYYFGNTACNWAIKSMVDK